MDEENAFVHFWQDELHFTRPPHHRSGGRRSDESPKPVDWPPDQVPHEGRMWLQYGLHCIEPGYLYMRLLCLSGTCGEIWRSSNTKRVLSWLPLVLVCLMGAYIGYLVFHAAFGQLHDPFQPHLTQASELKLTSHILDDPAELYHLARATETSLLTYMKVHTDEVCKLTRQHYLTNGQAATLTIIAVKHEYVVSDQEVTLDTQLMWNPSINNVTYEWYNRVWSSTTYKAVQDARQLLCHPQSPPSNESSLHVRLLDEIVLDYNTALNQDEELPHNTATPTIHTGTIVKPLAHCIQEEFLRANLISWEHIASSYEFQC